MDDDGVDSQRAVETPDDVVFREAFLAHHVPMVVAHPTTGVVRAANEAAASLYDRERTSLQGVSLPELGGWETTESPLGDDADPETDGELPLDEGSQLVRQQQPSGEEHVLELLVSRVEWDGEQLALVVMKDVTRRQELERRLTERTARSETLNSLLRHDIRNDMSVLMGTIDTLSPHVTSEGEDALRLIRSKAEHVVELTETARNVAETLRLGTNDAATQPIGLREPLHGEIEEARSSYPDATIRVDGEIPDVTVRGDELLDSVFRNLINNAIQHNDQSEPTVAVGVSADDSAVRVRVADDGPGIPPEQRDRIFQRGERGPTSTGTGLGLYLVGALVDRYGGDVSVIDNEPRGAVFTVTLETATEIDPETDAFGGVADGS